MTIGSGLGPRVGELTVGEGPLERDRVLGCWKIHKRKATGPLRTSFPGKMEVVVRKAEEKCQEDYARARAGCTREQAPRTVQRGARSANLDKYCFGEVCRGWLEQLGKRN